MDIREPEITREDILFLKDGNFEASRVCLVTGAASGIGRALAIAAAANGITVVGLDINEEELNRTQSLARDLGGLVVPVRTDLTSDEDMERAVREAAALGSIRYLANIAGIQHIDSIENFPMAKYDLMQCLMVRSPFFLSKLVIPHMKKNDDGVGVIGNMSSIHGHISTLNKPSYNITKFGVRALTQSIAAEGAGSIRSFSVSTGFIRTALALGQIPAQAKQRGISEEEVVRNVMLGPLRVKEMMTPVEVANLFIFGFSKHARYLVGGDLLFDGGVVLTY